MIYGYLRVSTDKQEIAAQKSGVDKFAAAKGWAIEQYISDEGVSGGKDPSKRKLGPLLDKLRSGDVVIAAEISRLGRDLYMVMDILHLCMSRGCTVCTVKDGFVLGDDIQSKVLAFAFGLAAEIERQMICQRTKEGLRLRMRMGVLVGRPPSESPVTKFTDKRETVKQMVEWQCTPTQIANVVGCNRSTAAHLVELWGLCDGWKYHGKLRDKHPKTAELRYKDTPYAIVQFDREQMRELIEEGLTIPQIAEKFNTYTYEQVYDSILADTEFNNLYRKFGQKKIKKAHY